MKAIVPEDNYDRNRVDTDDEESKNLEIVRKRIRKL
jgi:hypothetical protein